jgi:phenylacetate-CoA ligase
MILIPKFRERLYRREITSLERQYGGAGPSEDQSRLQLNLWNAEWGRIARQVPYWRDLQRTGGLPAKFASWDDFLAKVPITSRQHLKDLRSAMTSTAREPDFHRITGGSTAEPTQIPAWNAERRATRADRWIARRWYGITPGSRLFMIWGHSHLLGTGARKWINGRIRIIRDNLLGYSRFSAYDLQPQVLKRAGEELIRFRPEYVMGYSVALDMFARANGHLREQLHALHLKAVVATAEAFPAADSEALLRDLFGCRIAMEYGAVETDVLAHTHPEGGYRVFWRNYFLEAEADPHCAGMKLRVTSLYPRCFPLVRYEIGDEIEPCTCSRSQLSGILAFRRVIGRCNAYVVLADGARIHSEAFSHVLRGYPDIDGYQVIQENGRIRLLVRSRKPLDPETEHQVRITLRQVHPGLELSEIERVNSLRRTIAGKTPMVLGSEV